MMIFNSTIAGRLFLLIAALLFISGTPVHAKNNNYEIGAGIADITGEVVGIPYFGYGRHDLHSRGLRDRQYSRAFIIREPGGKPVVFVSIDKGAMFQSVNNGVMAKLKEKFGDLYTDDNVVISATHTHVAAGGQAHFALYKSTARGFYKKSYDVEVDGIVRSIERAHASLAPGRIYFNRGSLKTASIQRSLTAYKANPEAADHPNVDDEMTVLKFVQGRNKEIGLIAWFAVHPVSLPNGWDLSSADNKGYPSNRFEILKGSSYDERGAFVAAFAQSNAGDMSPNLHTHAPNDGTSDHATGTGDDPEENLTIIGERQFQSALEVYNNANIQLEGSISFVSRYADFSNTVVDKEFTDGKSSHTTCPPALGRSFAAGAEESRFGGIFKEGTTKDPSKGNALAKCHAEKPILIPLGVDPFNRDLPAIQTIIPTTLFKIGQLGILAAPAEFTITSGRRARATVEAVAGTGITETVFAGYADSYTGYVATREEYAVQEYEGASTNFGPWTSAAYRQEFSRLAKKMADPSSDPWPELEPKPLVLPEPADKTTRIFVDRLPSGIAFGAVHTDVQDAYAPGEKVQVVFWGAHPNNKLNTGGSYLRVERQTKKDDWVDVALDRDQNTKLEWERHGIGISLLKVTWDIPKDAEPGLYRISHNGASKTLDGTLTDYSGLSRVFSVK